MPLLIDGKKISTEIKDELKITVEELKKQGVETCLAVIQVGDDPASSIYVRNKKGACAYVGIESLSYELPEETTEEELVKLVFWYSFRFQSILMQIRLSVRFHRIKMWTDFILKA